MNLYGVQITSRYKKRTEFWQQTVDLTCFFENTFRCTADPPDKVWRQYCQIGGAPQPPETLSGWFETMAETCGLSADELLQLHGFEAGLGTTDLEGQLAHCLRYRRQFTDFLENSREQYRTKGKLMGRLWMFGSIGIALLLI